MKQSIGTFLLRRLQEVGIRHIFSVPGDYNLELMQQLEDRGEPTWIGNCNELNASYATDAYARINGIGALIVTHGVGALSTINGIARWRSDAPHSRRSRKRELLSYVCRGDGCPGASYSGGFWCKRLKRPVPRRNARDDRTSIGEGSFQGAAL
jgi:hypothetical protein